MSRPDNADVNVSTQTQMRYSPMADCLSIDHAIAQCRLFRVLQKNCNPTFVYYTTAKQTTTV